MTKIPSTNNPADLSPILAARLKAAAEALKEGLILKGPKGTGKANLTPAELENFRYPNVDLSGAPKVDGFIHIKPREGYMGAFSDKERLVLKPSDYSIETGTIPGQTPIEGEIGGKSKYTKPSPIMQFFDERLAAITKDRESRANPIEITGHVIND